MNRREFLKHSGIAVGAAALGGGCTQDDSTGGPSRSAGQKEVRIVCDAGDRVASSSSAKWAADQLCKVLASRGVNASTCERLEDVPPGAACIVASGSTSQIARDLLAQRGATAPSTAESLALASGTLSGRAVTLACGYDARGLVYALTELADSAAHATDPVAALTIPSSVVEKPANQVRSIMRLFSSDVEDKPWFNDRGFWERYLTMLVTNRFNRFNLALGLGYDFPNHIRDAYFYFAYPFLLSVPGYDVRVPLLPDSERDSNLAMLKFIGEQCARRGLDFQLGIWTHAYEWTDSPQVNYTVEGLNAQKHGAYCREAIRLLLRECPNVTGVTFRVHGESGVAEGSYDFWRTLFEGVATCGRPVPIDMHAKGMDQPMIDLALATGLPITISPKYWAEHMGLPYHQAWIRPTEMPREQRGGQGFFSRSSGSRSFLRYGYGDLMREDRKYGIVFRMWPGTQRVLLWGDPEMAAAYGRASSFCGALGLDLFEPLSFKGRKGSGMRGGRDAYADESLRPAGGDFEKFSYSYRLWGRLSYNPDAPPEAWRRQWQPEQGDLLRIEKRLASASPILPLITTAHLPSAANNSYWPEVYTNMPIVDASRRHPYGDTPSPKRFGTVSPLDPQLFSRIDEFAGELVEGDGWGKYAPPEVAAWLLAFADEAADVPLVGMKASGAGRRAHDDVMIQAQVGRFFAWKIRAGTLWALFVALGDTSLAREALIAYRTAREAWLRISDFGRDYAPDITYGLEKQLRGNWSDRLAAIDQDIADMETRGRQERAPDQRSPFKPEQIRVLIASVMSPPARPRFSVAHAGPAAFKPGEPLPISLTIRDAPNGGVARLVYRHVNQAEPWQSMAMGMEGVTAHAAIPGQYTNSPFPLQYYFDLRKTVDSVPALYPGLGVSLMNQPYFVVKQARAT
jgi:hypothetical protein